MTGNSTFAPNILASLIDSILLVSPEGIIKQGNFATEEMFRQSQDAFCGKSITEFFPNHPEIEMKIKETCQDGTSFRDIECFGRRKNEHVPFPASLTIAPYLPGEQGIQWAVLHIRDRSLVQELEETSRQIDQISRMGVLSLGMAHEIKNPLVAISGSAQLLKSRLEDEEHKEYLDIVIKEVDRINRMMSRMLSLAERNPPNLEPINIHRILEEILILEKDQAKNKIEFIQCYDPSLPQIPGDEDQLKQVFLNLIRNAREALQDGGKIKLTTRFRSDYTVKTKNNPSPHQDIVVEIADDGVGIPEEHLKTLFVPFQTTKSKGSGLGLPISLKIVENHHGNIKVISSKGEGTQVQVFLPIQQV
ncbi:MAG: PAS domain-containing protein [Candidatus Nitronauta litoralis]|uniref:histidine kinase n=1 Tax=Candidatus Nitronauta litoralis TaxID=2705533 RepID=A0A7T0G082_9BACT|nr:MAG: PAS domain-containing protein [Candidatus Nitronauta litoralis]